MAESFQPPADGLPERRRFLGGVVSAGVLGTLAPNAANAQPPPAPKPSTNQPPNNFPALDHAAFMRRAIVQAKQVPLLPFGAVIVEAATGKVQAEGHNRSSLNPTWHGEIDVINRQAAQNPQSDWSGLVLYTTAEPCAMCQAAIEWAGIALVVFGSSIPFLQKLGWWQIDLRAEEIIRRTPFRKTAILGGILEAECNTLFEAVPRAGRELKKIK